MSFYNLGNEVHTTETYSKIADAINEETAKMLVDILNVAQKIESKNVLWMKVQEGWSLEKVQALAAYVYLAVQLMPNKKIVGSILRKRRK